MAKQQAWDEEMSTEPRWPTFVRGRLAGDWRDGVVLGAGKSVKDRSVWLYRAVPLAPVADARSEVEMERASEPLLTAYEELAALGSSTGRLRAMNRSSYRETHLMVVNIPQWWKPPRDLPLADYLARSFPNTRETRARLVLLGVRLTDSVGGSGGWKAAAASAAETVLHGGVPISDYAPDARRVSLAMARAGLRVPTHHDFRIAESWWNNGAHPDTYVLPQQDCLHVFATAAQAAAAKRLIDEGADSWGENRSTTTITMASVQDLDLPFVPGENPRAQWITQLLDADALVVSVRGLVEPAAVTRGELRRNRQRNESDINARAQAGKMDRAEQDEHLQLLTDVEGVYSSRNVPSTLTDAVITVGFDGYVADMATEFEALTATIGAMPNRQRQAMAETMLASPVRANAARHDLPVHTVAYSGVCGLSQVGDQPSKRSLLLGWTERDKQASWLDPMAAADEDSLPIGVVPGMSGSGKAIALYAPVPVPTSTSPSGWTTMGDLQVGDTVFGGDGKPCTVTFVTPTMVDRPMYRVSFDDGTHVDADFEHQWLATDARTRNGRGGKIGQASLERRRAREADADRLAQWASRFHDSHTSDLGALLTIVRDEAGVDQWSSPEGVRNALKYVECSPASTTLNGRHVWSTSAALKALSHRYWISLNNAPLKERGEMRYTTAEMIAAGVTKNGASNFAIRLQPVLGETADLPVDPYVFGLWLGDGGARDGWIASAVTVTDESGLSDQAFVIDELARRGYEATPQSYRPDYVINVPRLRGELRAAGLLGNKHIPVQFMRASYDQRLELLQGLMDSDGYVIPKGYCVFTQKDDRLFEQVRSLVRSLGIKVMPGSKVPVSYPDENGVRKDNGATNSLQFVTDAKVARLPRKAGRLVASIGKRGRWKYVTSIEPIDTVPCRCITVDSPDHTYLVDEYTVTSNTQLLLWMARQAAESGVPVILVDPKTGSDHSTVVKSSGNGQVYSLDELVAADGVFDPLRFSTSTSAGVELAASMVMSVNPWGSHLANYEVPLLHALQYGVSKGATCTGQALQTALADGQATTEMVTPVFQLMATLPTFRAMVGMNPQGEALKAHDGVTLIKVGSASLNLPDAAQTNPSLPQRVALALVRMMVFGSAMALTGRNGMILLDEAWVFLGAGREEMERLGRLARSQRVFPMLFTQRVTDAVNAGLSGYISRGVILPIEDPAEARAALDLFKIEPTEQRLRRITAGARKGDAWDFDSMRALRDPITGQVHRGAVGLYCDLSKRAVPVEIVLPDDFLRDSSTTERDILARKEREAANRARLAVAAPPVANPIADEPPPDVRRTPPSQQPPVLW